MRKIKGCGNDSCEAYKKKVTYKEAEALCSECGSSLAYVCKDCYTQLSDDSEKYCARCLAKHKDRKVKNKKVAARVGGGALLFGSVMFKYGKKAFDVVKKFKG